MISPTAIIPAVMLAAQATLNVTPEETRVESAAYMSCIKTNAKKLDDGISDAETIAKAVMATCDQEMRIFVTKLATGQSERRRNALMNAFEERFFADSLVAVLAHRTR